MGLVVELLGLGLAEGTVALRSESDVAPGSVSRETSSMLTRMP
jgi:hypothetical protein